LDHIKVNVGRMNLTLGTVNPTRGHFYLIGGHFHDRGRGSAASRSPSQLRVREIAGRDQQNAPPRTRRRAAFGPFTSIRHRREVECSKTRFTPTRRTLVAALA
jgi:hypothetical protein